MRMHDSAMITIARIDIARNNTARNERFLPRAGRGAVETGDFGSEDALEGAAGSTGELDDLVGDESVI